MGVVDVRSTHGFPGQGAVRSLNETTFAKEDKKRIGCRGNHLGCRLRASMGLQCGLSGSRVARPATPCRGAERETAEWKREVPCGEILPVPKP